MQDSLQQIKEDTLNAANTLFKIKDPKGWAEVTKLIIKEQDIDKLLAYKKNLQAKINHIDYKLKNLLMTKQERQLQLVKSIFRPEQITRKSTLKSPVKRRGQKR